MSAATGAATARASGAPSLPPWGCALPSLRGRVRRPGACATTEEPTERERRYRREPRRARRRSPRATAAAAEVIAPSSVRVRGGHDRLFQVLFNLCMNALQAQPDGGRLRVRVSREVERREGLDDREMACVEVADAGAA